ncbi:hypothetical protein JZ751_003129 [Albula glossodonta]|uniref:Ig-like domain-containing protein n=1 Tax=Albula glossodonta TaxID=121402 RepID=A0A8T2ND66_9TELE|nr:hypothetical protein JZ751_003129 [Albula glossodonta]
MIQAINSFTIALLWFTGLAVSNKVDQSPSDLVIGSGGSIQLNCSHAISFYDQILWYHLRQQHGARYHQLHNSIALLDRNMIRTTASFTIVWLLLTGLAASNKVDQSPSDVVISSGGSIQLNCSHAIPSYRVILWYHRTAENSALTLIGYVYYKDATIEKPFEGHYNLSGDGEVAASLHVPRVKSADSGVYFCAASMHKVCFPHYKNRENPL